MYRFKEVAIFVFIATVFLTSICVAQGGETASAQSRLLTERAAIVDAQRNLVELIYGLNLSSGTTVRDFIVDQDTIRSNLDDFIKGAKQIGKTVFLQDGTAEVVMEVDVKGVNEAIAGEVLYYENTVTVMGHGSPPSLKPKPPKSIPKVTEQDTVRWYEKVLKISGKGAQPTDVENKSQAKLMAERAAKMDAYRNLLEIVRGTVVYSNTKVEDFETQYDIVKTNLQAFLKGAKVIDIRHLPDGTAEVDIEYNLRKLKNLIESVW